MNIGWIFDWIDTIGEVENLLNAYQEIISPEFYDPDSNEPEEIKITKATLWLARDEYLNVCVDLIRDLFWHNLENRYPVASKL